MGAYLIRRLLLVVPTLFGIIAINFVVVQFAPGGPVEQMIAELRGRGGETIGRVNGQGGAEVAAPSGEGLYRGARGLDPHTVADIRRMFGFDKPPLERFGTMLKGYLTFDFGRSFFLDEPVLKLIGQKMPVLVGYAVPGFLFAILLVVLFAGGSFLSLFPLRGLTSPEAANWAWPARVLDYLWHMVLPTVALVVGGFAGLTMLTKNCFLEEIRKQYTVTARAKGASEQRVLYRHVFRNAMLLIIAGFPAAFINILFSSALLVEIIFSLNGLGLLGFESAIRRDYPVMFGTLYIFTLLGLLMQIVGDLLYTVIDPRIDFEARR